MKTKFFLLFAFAALSACQYDLEIDEQQQAQQNEIMRFLQAIKEKQQAYASTRSSTDQTVEKLDELIQSIDYASTEEKILKGNRKVLLVNIKKLSTIPTAKKLKLILYLNDMDIVRGKIVSFDQADKVDHNKVIELLLNRYSHTFTGQLSTYTLSQKFFTSASFEEGVIRSSSRVSKHRDLPNGGRLDECIDYYLVTTYYNSSGMVTGQNWRFLVRECDDNPCDDPYEDSRMDCGGSGGGSQTPGFPTNPANGAQFVVIGENEEEIHWLYTCDAAGCSWSVIYKVLPMLVVATQPENYEKLQGIQPVHGQSVYNDDGFLYTYNWFDDTWEGESLSSLADEWEDEICFDQTFLNNPCILNAWNKLQNNSITFNLLTKVISESAKVEVCLFVANQIQHQGEDANGITNGGTYPISVTISAENAANLSELEVARTLLHEMIHAEMYRKILSVGGQSGLSPDNFPGIFDYYSRYLPIPKADGTWHYPNGSPQHNLMAQHYIEQMAQALMEFDGIDSENYMMLPIYEAYAWNGLTKTTVWTNMDQVEKNYITIKWLELQNRPRCGNE